MFRLFLIIVNLTDDSFACDRLPGLLSRSCLPGLEHLEVEDEVAAGPSALVHFCRQHVVACPEGRCRDIVIPEGFLLVAGDDSQCRLRMADLPAGQVVADDLFPVQVDDGPIVAAEAHPEWTAHPDLRNLEPGAEVGGDVFIFLVRSEPDPGR